GWANQAADRQLHTRLEQAEGDLALARDLDRVRQQATALAAGRWDPDRVRAEDPGGLAPHGLDVLAGDIDRAGPAVHSSPVREDIVAALDDWAVREETNPRRRQRLLGLANRADEPDPWRQAVRRAVARGERGRLRRLARRAGGGKPTPGVVLLLARA